jgi:hypothetical protein
VNHFEIPSQRLVAKYGKTVFFGLGDLQLKTLPIAQVGLCRGFGL